MNCVIRLLILLSLSGIAFGQKPEKTDPCAEPQSQAEMNMCARKKYRAAEIKLNQVYEQLTKMLTGPQKLQLKEAQASWLKYRDTNCEFVADEYKGGSIRPLILATCLEEVTLNRTTELKAQIEERTH